MKDSVKPYYQVNPCIKYCITVAVFGDLYVFDCLEHANDFIHQILAYSVAKPTITLTINICEVDE